MGLSLSHLLIILVVVLVIFGAGRLPQVMGDLARGLKAFKDGLHKEEETKEELKSKGKKVKERLKK